MGRSAGETAKSLSKTQVDLLSAGIFFMMSMIIRALPAKQETNNSEVPTYCLLFISPIALWMVYTKYLEWLIMLLYNPGH